MAKRPSLISRMTLPPPGHALVMWSHPNLEVKENVQGAGTGVFGTGRIEQEALLFSVIGRACETPSRWTVQIGTNEHLGLVDGESGQKWQYINHNCEPSAQLVVTCLGNSTYQVDIVAIRRMERGEEICLNYLASDLNMREAFQCKCDSKETCFGLIQGFAHINQPNAIERLRPLLVPYLKNYLTSANALEIKKNCNVNNYLSMTKT